MYVTGGTRLRDMSCGEMLVDAMTRNHVTVGQLSEMTGLSDKVIRNLRNGRSQGTTATWAKIARAINIDMNEIIRRAR